MTITSLILILHSANSSESFQKTDGTNAQINYSFVGKWGSLGTGPGEFNRPHDIGFDSRDIPMSVIEIDNRIQKFTHNGTFIITWGSKGDKNWAV